MRNRLPVSILTPAFLLVICVALNSALSKAQTMMPSTPALSAPDATPANSEMKASRSSTAGKEEWTALALAQSGLPTGPIDAALLGKYEQPDYTRELWRVQWRPDDPIDLYVILPHGVTKPRAILYLYDYRFDTDRFRDEGWCKRATQGGFAAVGFVSALSGQRFHSPRPMKEWFVSQLQEALGTSTHDVQMVLNFLASQGDGNLDKTGIFAEASGGAIAVLAAEADARISALDLLNPWGDWPDWLKDSPQVPDAERATYLKPEFLAGVADLDPVAYLPQLHLKALRIQQIMDDEITPPSAREKIAASVPDKDQIVRYKDTTQHVSAWRKTGLTGWIKEQLQQADEAVSGLQ
jgi:hypothetical protein